MTTPSAFGGIYLHIPFCRRKCPYCDFHSTSDLSGIPDFVSALLREMDLLADTVRFSSDTIYLGGGTPTVLPPEQIDRIITAVHRRFDLQPDPEITIEANPGTLTPETLRALRRCGINRINIGVQSFNDRHLRFLGRIHSAADARAVVLAAGEAGFNNIGIDLIYGLPGQTRQDWQRDMEAAIALQPDHLSCYTLTYEPGTPLTRQKEKGRFLPLPEGRVGDLFEMTVRFLAGRGYECYEISNFARSRKRQSRHNRKYWSGAPYVGLGPSAHGFLPDPPLRYWNHASLADYRTAIRAGKRPVAGAEVLDREQQITEAIYLGLRQTEGIDIRAFEQRFGIDFQRRFGDLTAMLQREGMVRPDEPDRRCALTIKGMRFLDSVAGMMTAAGE